MTTTCEHVPRRHYVHTGGAGHGHTTVTVCGQVDDATFTALAQTHSTGEPAPTNDQVDTLRDVVLGVAALTAAWEGEAIDCEPHPDWATARARDQRRHLSTLRAVVAGLRRVLAPGLPDPTTAAPTTIAASAPLTLAAQHELVAEVAAVVRRHPGTPIGSAVIWDVVEVVAARARQWSA